MHHFRDVISHADVDEAIDELGRFHIPTSSKLEGKIDVAEIKKSKIPTLYFAGDLIVKCSAGSTDNADSTNSQSPEEYYKQNEGKYSALSPSEALDRLQADIPFCPLFPIQLALAVYQYIERDSGIAPRLTLDMEPEWGDRLIAAIIMGVPYTSSEPETDAHQRVYSSIVDQLGDSDTENYIVTRTPLAGGQYDIVFASDYTSIRYLRYSGYLVLVDRVVGDNVGDNKGNNKGNNKGIVRPRAVLSCGGRTATIIHYTPAHGGDPIPDVSADKFKRLRFDKMAGREIIEKALEIVRAFIVRKQRILAGGMSIDCALRLKGSKLYPDDEIPDYDFLSPNNNADAYELSQLLCEADMPNVDVINAIHVTTQKVRVMGTVVADITYAHPGVFEKMQKLEYAGMAILHPLYIMLDQFNALAMPYENAPMEVITQRWKKDVKRLNLLYSAYPITYPEEPLPKMVQHTLPKPGNFILTGWGALAYYESIVPPSDEKYPRTSWSSSACTIPAAYLTFMTDDWRNFPVDNKNRVYHNTMMGFPQHFEQAGYHVHDTLGNKIGTNPDAPYPVASPPALAWYFMHRWLRYGDVSAHYGVVRTINIIKTGKVPLSEATYGKYIWNTSFVKNVRQFFNPSENKYMPPMLSCKSPKPAWDPKTSPYYCIDGSPCDAWEDPFDIKILDITKDIDSGDRDKDQKTGTSIAS